MNDMYGNLHSPCYKRVVPEYGVVVGILNGLIGKVYIIIGRQTFHCHAKRHMLDCGPLLLVIR